MTAEQELLRATVADLLNEHCTAERVAAASGDSWDAARWQTLWQALESTGLTLVGTPEEAGGSGGDLAAAADIAVAAGAAAAPVPLAETLAAGMVLARAGVDIPSGPLTLAVAADPDVALRRVPYGRWGTTVAVGLDRDDTDPDTGAPDSGAPVFGTRVLGTGVVGTGGGGEWLAVASRPARVQAGRNLAGEPRDEVELGAEAEFRPVPAGTADYTRSLLRLFRSLLIAGAAQRALDLTVAYVNEREQFGRPLARFPVVQQEIARMAGEVALITAATQAAIAAGPDAGTGAGTGGGTGTATAGGGAMSAVLAAKAQASHGAGTVAAIAHQLHGAIGTTEEHRLRLTTTRLWSWRDEDGPAAECFTELGRAALGAAHRGGGLWPWLTG
ncbi:MAG TPA: acyl-CoA dehydrogenase family protein [Streptosporangiaceae bacterium]